jgi:hypothetical protein
MDNEGKSGLCVPGALFPANRYKSGILRKGSWMFSNARPDAQRVVMESRACRSGREVRSTMADGAQPDGAEARRTARFSRVWLARLIGLATATVTA